MQAGGTIPRPRIGSVEACRNGKRGRWQSIFVFKYDELETFSLKRCSVLRKFIRFAVLTNIFWQKKNA